MVYQPRFTHYKIMHATICDLIADLVHNAIEADASEVSLTIEETAEQLNVVITDNGKGMSAETLDRAKDPFWSDGTKHRHRKVGLGLPFLYQTTETAGGEATIKSELGSGTTVCFRLDLKHLDCPAFGRFATAATALMSYGQNDNLTIERTMNGKRYTASKKELAEVLGDLNTLENLNLMRKFFKNNEEGINEI